MNILVIGASGFVGRHLAHALLHEGHAIRCLARDPAKIKDLQLAGCEVVAGDISDSPSLRHALTSIQAVYVTINTLSAQHSQFSSQGYMDIEMNGLKNIVEACKLNGTWRLIYITSMGTSPTSSNLWLRERWKEEQFLQGAGLETTVLRPGQIVGIGGKGFDTMVANAKRPFNPDRPQSGQQRWRSIAVDDLIYYLVGVLNDPRAYQHAYNVGCDDILTYDEMIDVTACILRKAQPSRTQLPGAMNQNMAPVLQNEGRFPKEFGSSSGSSGDEPMTGDCLPIRLLLPRPPLRYQEAVLRALRPDRKAPGCALWASSD